MLIWASVHDFVVPLKAHHVLSQDSLQRTFFLFFFAEEPRYADPFAGAHPSFQQRLAELSSLENETIRWERSRKFKKKMKPENGVKET